MAEIYEKVEVEKQPQMMELQKQRMESNMSDSRIYVWIYKILFMCESHTYYKTSILALTRE